MNGAVQYHFAIENAADSAFCHFLHKPRFTQRSQIEMRHRSSAISSKCRGNLRSSRLNILPVASCDRSEIQLTPILSPVFWCAVQRHGLLAGANPARTKVRPSTGAPLCGRLPFDSSFQSRSALLELLPPGIDA